MPFNTGAISLGAIQDLWKRPASNSSISFSDFDRLQNEDNFHSPDLPLAASTAGLSLSDFRGVAVPLAGDVDTINASGNSSTTDIVASSQRFNPGIDVSVENAWVAAGRSGGIPNAVVGNYISARDWTFDQNGHYFFANSGTYMYFQDEDNPGLNDVGDFARVTLSTAYDITTPTASSYVDYNINRVDLRTIVNASKPGSRHSSSTNSGTPEGIVPPCIYMKNDGTKIWGVALDMRWMSESFSNSDGDTLVEFTLTTAYDISTATWSTYHVFTDDNVKNSKIMGFSMDGLVLLVQGQDYSPTNKRLSKYTLSSAFNISTISYSGSTSFSTLNSLFEDIAGIDFYQGLSSNKPTKAFFTSYDAWATPTSVHYSYNMSLSGSAPSFTLTGSTTTVGTVPFANGSKRFQSDTNRRGYSLYWNHNVPAKVLSLSTAYDLDTCSSYNPATFATSTPSGVTLVDGDIKIESQGMNLEFPNVCICWSKDGTKVFYLGTTGSDIHPKIYTENCTTPWTLEGVNFNVSSSTNSNYPLPFTSTLQQALGIELNDDGTKLFVTYATYTSSGSFFNRKYTGYSYLMQFTMNSQPVYAPYTIANNGTTLTQDGIHQIYSTGSSSSVTNSFSAYNLQTRFSPDGKSLLLIRGGSNEDLLQKTLSVAYDIFLGNSSAWSNATNTTAQLRLQKTGTGSFWTTNGDNEYNVVDVGVDGYSVISQYPYTADEADNKVAFRTINQNESTLPNVVASLFSGDRIADGFTSQQASDAQSWSSGMSGAAESAAHSLEVKKEFVANSSGRWPAYHDYKYLPNGNVLQFCGFFDDDIPDFFRIFTIS